jgi:hypothetical protein
MEEKRIPGCSYVKKGHQICQRWTPRFCRLRVYVRPSFPTQQTPQQEKGTSEEGKQRKQGVEKEKKHNERSALKTSDTHS